MLMEKFQMCKLDLEKAEDYWGPTPEIKLPTSVGS